MSDKIITMACLYKESVKEANQLRKEIDIKDKRISLLTETLASRDKDIETLKAEITRLNNELLQNDTVILKDLENKISRLQKVIKAMATWIHENELTPKLNIKCDVNCLETQIPCEQCIIKYFESEVKE